MHTIPMSHTKDTKNTVVYTTPDETAAVTQLYVRKAAFVGAAPASITVIIKEGK